ncbi:MAG: GH25 family lysozyme [Olsenella sp.]|nr:GH25 family lysozyme [Olsenella sp.]
MAMQGIDISYFQRSIDLSKVTCDFVIVKATQGTNYISSACDAQVQQAIGLKKPFGFYHYVNGSGATAEADFFVDNCKGYFGRGIPCIDWEDGEDSDSNNAAWGDTDYLRRLVQRVIDRTGVRPIIYAPASAFPWDVAQALKCGTWVAQYASMEPVYGYQDTPWNEGAYACAIRQYSSHGRLDDWGGDLDIDKAYMDADGWQKFVGAASSEPTGWIQKDGRWWYRHSDGSYTQNGWESIDGKWYLFDADGWMLTGWQKVGGKWYFLTDSGAMATGWVNDGGKWYYMDPGSGAMHAADIESIGGRWYAFGPSGEMQYGVASDSSGALKV